MPRRLIASLFLFVWLALLGIEFVEQTGLFVFSDQAVDDQVDAAVLGLGLSVPETATAVPVVSRHVVSLPPIAAVLEYDGEFVSGREAATLGSPPPIRSLHCTFLI